MCPELAGKTTFEKNLKNGNASNKTPILKNTTKKLVMQYHRLIIYIYIYYIYIYIYIYMFI